MTRRPKRVKAKLQTKDERLRNRHILLCRALVELRESLEAQGDCDHAVNVCVCNLRDLIAAIEEAVGVSAS
jgi:hypothetical protein